MKRKRCKVKMTTNFGLFSNISWKIKAHDQKLMVYLRKINQIVAHQREPGEKGIKELKRGFQTLVV